MKTYFAYTRVSTTRQGEGVSLQEQRTAILEYAAKRRMMIGHWYEEQESAAKRGRPVFTRLVSLLKSWRADGIIIHKIDRGARNLRDWADMAELMDCGVEVHFAHESIDLHTRSGRLTSAPPDIVVSVGELKDLKRTLERRRFNQSGAVMQARRASQPVDQGSGECAIIPADKHKEQAVDVPPHKSKGKRLHTASIPGRPGLAGKGDATIPGEREIMASQRDSLRIAPVDITDVLRVGNGTVVVRFESEEDCDEALIILADNNMLGSPVEFLEDGTTLGLSLGQVGTIDGKVKFLKV